MAGLTARDGAQFRALIELRRRLSFRRFKGRPQEAAVTIVFLLLALPLPFLIWCTAILRRPHPSSDLVLLFTAINLFVLSVVFFILAMALLLPLIAIVDF